MPMRWRHGRRVVKRDWAVVSVLEKIPALESDPGVRERYSDDVADIDTYLWVWKVAVIMDLKLWEW